MATKVGWTWIGDIPDIMVLEPEKFKFPEITNPDYNKRGVTECPSYRQYFNNLYVLRSPIQFKIHARPGEVGVFQNENVIKPPFYPKAFIYHEPNEMYNLDNPIFQVRLDYLFAADEDCTLELLPPFMHRNNWPGQMTPGTFNIHKWIRNISWGFVWEDLSKPLEIKEGDPLAYVRFTTPKNNNVKLVEMQFTDELKKRTLNTGQVSSWSKGVFKFMENSLRRRPKKLIVEKK